MTNDGITKLSSTVPVILSAGWEFLNDELVKSRKRKLKVIRRLNKNDRRKPNKTKFYIAPILWMTNLKQNNFMIHTDHNKTFMTHSAHKFYTVIPARPFGFIFFCVSNIFCVCDHFLYLNAHYRKNDDYSNIYVGQRLYKNTVHRQWPTLTSSTACLILECRMMMTTIILLLDSDCTKILSTDSDQHWLAEQHVWYWSTGWWLQ